MSIKLTDTQIVMLSAAAQRDDRCLVAPRNLKGGAAQKVAAKLIDGWPRQGDQGEAGSASVEARRASRPILCAEAHGRGRQGDRRRRPLGFGRHERRQQTNAYRSPRLIRKSSGRLLPKFRQRTPRKPVRAPRRHEAGAGPRIASARLWRNARGTDRGDGLASAYHARRTDRIAQARLCGDSCQPFSSTNIA